MRYSNRPGPTAPGAPSTVGSRAAAGRRPGGYLDCELYLTDYHQAKLTVAGRDYSGSPHLDEALQRRLLQADLDPTQYGTFLFEALLGEADDLLAGYREGLAIARHEERRLRLRLHVATTAPQELHDLHWELLYDPKKKVALGRSRDTAFSRYLSVSLEAVQAVAETPVRLLLVLSTPPDLSEFQLAEIDRGALRRALENALSPLRGLVAYEFLDGPATPGRICDRLTGGSFHALHVHAHGTLRPDDAVARLVLEQEDGQAAFVEEAICSEIFEGDRDLRLVTLIACHSGVQPRSDPFSGMGPALVARGIPAVVAMRRAVSVDAAALFCQHFYRNLARGGRVDAAANEARLQLYLDRPQSIEWGTPALFMRLGDGRLWETSARAQKLLGVRREPPTSAVPWRALLTRIEAGKLIPILGPGVHRGLLPAKEEIAHRWADEYDYPLNGHDRKSLARVTQYMETTQGRHYPHDILARFLAAELLEREEVQERRQLSGLGLSEVIERIAERHFDRDENEPHRILAELPISRYLTTNFDSFMTAALKWMHRRPKRCFCEWNQEIDTGDAGAGCDCFQASAATPLVYHLYGNDESPTLQVLTEDDHLDFLREISANFNFCMDSGMRAALVQSMLLFVGYRVRDLDCRVLFRGLIKKLRDLKRGRIALIQPLSNGDFTSRGAELRHFMKRCCDDLDIEVYWCSDRDFLIELRDRWRAEHGSP